MNVKTIVDRRLFAYPSFIDVLGRVMQPVIPQVSTGVGACQTLYAVQNVVGIQAWMHTNTIVDRRISTRSSIASTFESPARTDDGGPVWELPANTAKF